MKYYIFERGFIMGEIKEKTKDFIVRNKTKLVIGGLTIVVVAGYVYLKNEREKLIWNTTIMEFQRTINWFDKNFPGINLRELWKTYVKENPEKIAYMK
jgi:hypothetical protein